MSYTTINRCANDPQFIARITACAAQVGQQRPEQDATDWRWTIAAHPTVEMAYEAAVGASNPAPGADPTVVTDVMILEAVHYLTDPANFPKPK